MATSEYIKIYHNNGSHSKIASGPWPEARATAEKQMTSTHTPMDKPLHGDENIEVEIWTRRNVTRVRSRDWRDIIRKMDGFARNAGEINALPTLTLLFGLTAWAALVLTLLPYL